MFRILTLLMGFVEAAVSIHTGQSYPLQHFVLCVYHYVHQNSFGLCITHSLLTDNDSLMYLEMV